MRRGVVIFLLMLSAFWQAFAVAGQAAAMAQEEERHHAAMHFEDVAHHHDDDGTIVVDGSLESLEHTHADGSVGSPALWTAVALPPVIVSSSKPAALVVAASPAPHPDGLRRPPRTLL
ncbi:MAG: hypothetical protein J0I65_26700 [Variovorax sp.]|jgi:hypothetical protein|uniref:Uncharacterized protein n=1 Tax=Variovorax paradoxus TaxID=34073 RepID=A0A2W5QEY7_VARPD|nr:hypothetical protein [Variovorax sp.]PZQ77061.1 MAG: hypothetical protein DI563_05045 [Variovorax paradoxus]